MRNPGGLVCRRTAENSSDLGLGSTPGPLFPGRRSWQQPGSLCGGPSGQKEEVHWQPSGGTQPAPPARTQVAPSALSRAPRSSRHRACQETPESWEGPGQEPLTCPSVLRSEAGVGQSRAVAWPWQWHCPTWPELVGLSVESSWGHLCSSGSCVWNRLQLCLPRAQGLLHVSFLFPLLVWTGLLLILSVH